MSSLFQFIITSFVSIVQMSSRLVCDRLGGLPLRSPTPLFIADEVISLIGDPNQPRISDDASDEPDI
jgi:hypothetical protein